MKRTPKQIFSLDALYHIKYVPRIIFTIKNWIGFLLNYVGLKNSSGTYVLRNGLKIRTNHTIDTATIVVIFFKKDYGTVPKNKVIIDIGANIGVYSIYGATNKRNKIYSYEPMKSTFKLLSNNVDLNNLRDRVKIFNKGISSKKRKIKLYLEERSAFNSIYGKGKKYEEIDCISLKDIFLENKLEYCDILKIDCEGAEFEIFYSANDKVLSKIKEIRMEYHDQTKKDYNLKGMISFMKEKGFKLTYLRKDTKDTGIVWFKKSLKQN